MPTLDDVLAVTPAVDLDSAIAATPAIVPAVPYVGAREVTTGRGKVDTSLSWSRRDPDDAVADLDTLVQVTHERARHSTSLFATPRDVEFVIGAETVSEFRNLKVRLKSEPSGLAYGLTDWSFKQLCGVAGAPAGYLQSLPAAITADALTYSLASKDQYQFLAFDDGNPDTAYIRAVTSPTYGRIGDHNIATAVRDYLQPEGWKVPGSFQPGKWGEVYDPDQPGSSTLWTSDRDMTVFLVDDHRPIKIGTLPNGNPDYVFRGVIVTNSDVGAGTLSVTRVLLRAVCENRILWGVERTVVVKTRHSKNAPHRWATEIRPMLRQYAQASGSPLIDAVATVKAAVIAKDDDEAEAFLRSRGLGARFSQRALVRHQQEEGHPVRSRWDAIQAVTAAAREIPHQSDRLTIEAVVTKMAA